MNIKPEEACLYPATLLRDSDLFKSIYQNLKKGDLNNHLKYGTVSIDVIPPKEITATSLTKGRMLTIPSEPFRNSRSMYEDVALAFTQLYLNTYYGCDYHIAL